MAAAPLSPFRIVTSIAVILAGLLAVLLAEGLLASSHRSTAQHVLLAVYGLGGLTMFVAAVPLADGKAWASHAATAACAAIALTWTILLADHFDALGAIFAGAFAALAVASERCRERDHNPAA